MINNMNQNMKPNMNYNMNQNMNQNINNNMNQNNAINNINGNQINRQISNNPQMNNVMNMNLNKPINNQVINNMGNNPMIKSANINYNQIMKNMRINLGNNMNQNNGMNIAPNNANNVNNNIPNNPSMNQNLNNTFNNINAFQINMNIIGNNLRKQNNNMMGVNNNFNNPSFQFMQNFGRFKVDFSAFNNMNINNKKKVNSDKDINQIMKDKEYEAFTNEIKIISEKLDISFSQDELANLTNKEDLLKYFFKEEEKLLKFIDENFGGHPFLKNYTLDEIKRIFTENPVINHISNLIDIEIKDMNLAEMKSEKEFHSQIKKKFKNIKMPKFLIDSALKELKAILFYSNRKEETTTIINNIKEKKSSESSIRLNNQLEKIRQNQNYLFEGINYREQLIYFFLFLNNLELKGGIWQKLFSYFLVSESITKLYFSNNFSHTKIFQEINYKDEQDLQQRVDNLYLSIEVNITNENSIYSIIASFYFFLFYLMKTSQNSTDVCNIGNTILQY